MLKFSNEYFQNILKIRGQLNKLGIKVNEQISSHFQLSKFLHNVFFLIKITKYVFKIVK